MPASVCRSALTVLTVSLLVAAALAIPLSVNSTTTAVETPAPFLTRSAMLDIAIDFAALAAAAGSETPPPPGSTAGTSP